MNANGIQRQSTPAMKADGLPFGCSGSEIGANLYTECSILPPGGVKCERFYDLEPVAMVDGAVYPLVQLRISLG